MINNKVVLASFIAFAMLATADMDD